MRRRAADPEHRASYGFRPARNTRRCASRRKELGAGVRRLPTSFPTGDGRGGDTGEIRDFGGLQPGCLLQALDEPPDGHDRCFAHAGVPRVQKKA